MSTDTVTLKQTDNNEVSAYWFLWTSLYTKAGLGLGTNSYYIWHFRENNWRWMNECWVEQETVRNMLIDTRVIEMQESDWLLLGAQWGTGDNEIWEKMTL